MASEFLSLYEKSLMNFSAEIHTSPSASSAEMQSEKSSDVKLHNSSNSSLIQGRDHTVSSNDETVAVPRKLLEDLLREVRHIQVILKGEKLTHVEES